MSLQYIIDGYNIIRHTIFIKHTPRNIKEQKAQLLEFIKTKGLCGSCRNKVTVVFDGYPSSGAGQGLDHGQHSSIIFSRHISADEKIRIMVEESADRKNIVVVSDDKEIKFMAKTMGARHMGIEAFIVPKLKSKGYVQGSTPEPELSYIQMHKINQELRKLWLK